jgi:DNA-binding beta-propeller fold protein YncE
MASPTKEIQKAAYSIADTGKNNTGADTSKTSGGSFFSMLAAAACSPQTQDGSDLKTIINEGRKFPDGLVVDTAAGHIYWTNMGNPVVNDGSIERADFGGSNVPNMIRPGGTFTPKQLQLDDKKRKLYWCDREGMRVMRANLDGSNIETLVDTSGGDASPGKDEKKWCVGVAVDADGSKIYWTQKGPENAGDGRIFRADREIPKRQTPANRKDIELLGWRPFGRATCAGRKPVAGRPYQAARSAE